MKIVIFGLTVSSSWGNGHATLWRGLIRALHSRGHTVTFFERDLPFYSSTRDLHHLPGRSQLRLYTSFSDIQAEARQACNTADLALSTSFCPDGRVAGSLLLDSNAATKAFYDLDTPVTLSRLSIGDTVPYLPDDGLGAFDLVLSYTGGRAITELQTRLGARRISPLYGWVDPQAHHPVPPVSRYRCDLSYLGTYAADRQTALETLFVEPARKLPHRRFVIGGAQFPDTFPWVPNLYFVQHMPPAEHPGFFCSSRLTLNVTRQAMADYGFCPSGRLFEAASCGTPIITDTWEGLSSFFTPGTEILPAKTTGDVLNALSLSDVELKRIAEAARARTLQEHTAEARAQQLEDLCASLPQATPTLTLQTQVS